MSNKGQLTDIEEIELSLIAADTTDAIRALISHRSHEKSGALSLLAFPVAGLVTEETYNYFSQRRRAERIGEIDHELLGAFRHSLKKVRARLKLFDDTDDGPERLVAFMALVRRQSRVLFAHPSSKLIQAISGPFRFDLGAEFVENDLVSTTHATLPALGITPEALADLKPGHFHDLHEFIWAFSRGIGAQFAQLAKVLSIHGRNVNLAPVPGTVAISLSSHDFIGRRFYRHVERSFHGVAPARIAALTLCLAQVNAALRVLPELLGRDSNLLMRAQYLAAYHGTRALQATLGSRHRWLDGGPAGVFSSRQLRNVFAHYELREAGKFALNASEPLQAAIAGISGLPPESVSNATQERLVRVSEFLGKPLSKSALQPIRSRLIERLVVD